MIVENGSTVSFHYTGTLEDGTEFDSSRDRDPLTSQVGTGGLIPGFENALIGMAAGEKKTFTIEAKDAYGEQEPEAIQEYERALFPEGFEAEVGMMVQGQNELGQLRNATIVESSEASVTLDFNHPLAGKDLSFDIEVVSVV
tara:strand:+ start:392 stop:817 length:426 start_codon:yes stop_codon:yes gene_type:complete